MFCQNCGKRLPDGARFCQNCGAAVPGAAETRPPEPPQEPVTQSYQEPVPPTYQQPVPPVNQQLVPQPRQNPVTPVEPVPLSVPVVQVDPGAPVLQPSGQKKKSHLGLIIGIAAGVLVLAAAVAAVLLSGVLASPKGRVERALLKTVSAYAGAGEILEAPDLAELGKKQSLSLGLGVDLKELNHDLAGSDLAMLSGLGLRLDLDYDGKGEKMDSQISALWGDDELLSGRFLADGARFYAASPQLTGGNYLGCNTELLGSTLSGLGYYDAEPLSFNLFELIEILTEPLDRADIEKQLKEANKALLQAVKVEKDGSETLDINGKSTRTRAYHVVIPSDALRDYCDVMEEIALLSDYQARYEDLLRAMHMPEEDIDSVMEELDEADTASAFREVDYLLDALGDVELDVFLSGGYVSAVTYQKTVEGSTLDMALYLGGGEQYVDDLSLEMDADGAGFRLESTGNHSGKGGVFTDETTFRFRDYGGDLTRLSSTLSYDTRSRSDNLRWELEVDDGYTEGSVKMEGSLSSSRDALELYLDEVTLETSGIDVLTLGVDCTIGSCKGVKLSVSSPAMLEDLDEMDLEDLGLELEGYAEDWLNELYYILPEDLLYALYYLL